MNNQVILAAPITLDSIVDGPGFRSVLWFQGCSHKCAGCINPQTHDINNGINVNIDNIINDILQVKLQSGVTLSGGDPLYQIEACIQIVKKLKEHNINIWCYTGFEYEYLITKQIYKDCLQYIDVLVDGPFIEVLQDYNLQFKGSSNQRIIDIQKSLQENKIILWEMV